MVHENLKSKTRLQKVQKSKFIYNLKICESPLGVKYHHWHEIPPLVIHQWWYFTARVMWGVNLGL
jgi:hypothetical protein